MQNELEIMRVLRLPPMGKLVVSFNNERYEAISEVSQANVRQLLQTAIGELITFAGGYQTLVDAGVAPPLNSSSASPASPGELSGQAMNANQFLNRMEEENDRIKAEKPLPKISLMANLRPRRAKSDASANKMMSLVEQVDQILQRHLLSDPELSQRKIHLEQDPNGGLIIDVDGKRYQRPRDIEDPRIQMMIKRALKEWEAI